MNAAHTLAAVTVESPTENLPNNNKEPAEAIAGLISYAI